MPIEPAPTSEYALQCSYSSTDFEEFQDFVSKSWVTQRAELLSPRQSYRAHLKYFQLRNVGLARLTSFGMIQSEAEPSDSPFMVHLLKNGFRDYKVSGHAIDLLSESIVVQSPGQGVKLKSKMCIELLSLHIDRTVLEKHLSGMLGRTIGIPLTFDSFAMKESTRKMFTSTVMRLWNELSRPNVAPDHHLALQQIEESLITLLIEGHTHNYSRQLHDGTRDVAPLCVRSAEEYICAFANEPLSLAEVAIAAGVNSRTVCYGFNRHRGYSPMQFLRTIRLQCVRKDLLHALPHTTVTAVATRWGFLHFGRFSGEYGKRFRELPSETLLRSRARNSQKKNGLHA